MSFPHPGHLPRFPAEPAGAVTFFWQCGHSKRIFAGVTSGAGGGAAEVGVGAGGGDGTLVAGAGAARLVRTTCTISVNQAMIFCASGSGSAVPRLAVEENQKVYQEVSSSTKVSSLGSWEAELVSQLPSGSWI